MSLLERPSELHQQKRAVLTEECLHVAENQQSGMFTYKNFVGKNVVGEHVVGESVVGETS